MSTINRVTLGDILRFEGPITARRAGGETRFAGFTRIVFKDLEHGESRDRVAFEALPVSRIEPPSTLPPESALQIPDKSLDENSRHGDDIHVELKRGSNCRFSFHYPNPLSPFSAGCWFTFTIAREGSGYAVDFNGRRSIFYWKRDLTEWATGSITRSRRLLGVRAWSDALEDSEEKFWFGRRQGSDRPSVASCVFFDRSFEAHFFPPSEDIRDDIGNRDVYNIAFEAIGDQKPLRIFIRYIGDSLKTDADDRRVNVSMFGFRERPDTPMAPMFARDPFEIRCIAAPKGVDRQAESWLTEWRGIPADSVEGKHDDFAFSTLWRTLAQHYTLGLHSSSAVNHLSFVPSGIVPENIRSNRWILRCLAHLDNAGPIYRPSDCWSVSSMEIFPAANEPVRLELGACERTDASNPVFGATLTRSTRAQPFLDFERREDAPAPELLSLSVEFNDESLGEFLIGGVRVNIGSGHTVMDPDAPTNLLAVHPSPDFNELYDRSRIDITLAWHFNCELPRPGSEDPERGFALEDAWLEREQPIIFDLGEANADESARVAITESASQRRSRLLQLIVRTNGATEYSTDVVVLDRNPFSVARVVSEDETSFEPDAVVAIFRDPPEGPPGWVFSTDTGHMRLVLPPQAIGEEMIKADLVVSTESDKIPVPVRGETFDFRLSPSTQLVLDRNDIPTARVTAAWALRRLLDRREGVTGLALVAADFELFYGLLSHIDESANLRLADQDAFVGRIPFADDLLAHLERRVNSNYTNRTHQYSRRYRDWIRGLMRRPMNLTAFRNFQNRERVIIRDGLSFHRRILRQTANPFTLHELNPETRSEGLANELHPLDREDRRLPLRGGLDFGFESPNIYDAFLNNQATSLPGEPQGSISGLAFGALGGTGSQEAVFDEGRTIIITETVQGRIHKLTIIRVGRIACLWNHARHVIVYERTTRTAPRYANNQPADFEGLAALRKVREFVEITQARRAYPDFDYDGVKSGPLTASTFESVTIPVKSSWGYDVNEGWVIRLRGPLDESEAPFYPFPTIFLELGRAGEKGEGAISQRVSNPEELRFFSSTRAGEGGDPDQWKARADVDFAVTRRPEAPRLKSLPSFAGASRQPDAAPFDYGQRRFTITLDPVDEGVNLVHNRPVDAVDARVRNVSIARGAPPVTRTPSNLDATIGSVFAATEAKASDGLREVAAHLRELRAQGGPQSMDSVGGARREMANVIKEVTSDVRRLKASISPDRGDRVRAANGWLGQQEKAVRLGQDAWRHFLAKGSPSELSGIISKIAEDLDADALSKAQAKSLLSSALKATEIQAIAQLERLPFVPKQAVDAITGTLSDLRGNSVSSVAALLQSMVHAIGRAKREFNSVDPDRLEADLLEVLLSAEAATKKLLDNTTVALNDGLGPLIGEVVDANGAGPLSQTIAKLKTEFERFSRRVELVVYESLPPFALAEPDWDALEDDLSLDQFKTKLEAVFDNLTQSVKNAIGCALSDWERRLDDARTKLERQFGDLEQKIDEALADVGEFERKMRSVVDALVQSVDDEVTAFGREIIEGLPGDYSLFEKAVDYIRGRDFKDILDDVDIDALLGNGTDGILDLLDKLDQEISKANAELGQVSEQVDEALQQVAQRFRKFGDQLETAVAEEVGDGLEGLEDGALELVRALAEGPVTDTLRSSREYLGYYYNAARDHLDVTNAAAIFNELGAGILNPLSTRLPFDRIRERLLPDLANFDVNKLFPSFAGLRLDHLLEGLTVPPDPLREYDWITHKHGFDKDRLSAWSEIRIDKRFDGKPELFELPPLALNVVAPQFKSHSRIEAGAGRPVRQETQGQLTADWVLSLSGQPVLTIEDGGLFFDGDGDFRFDFDIDSIQLAPALQFVTDAIRQFFPEQDGLTITPVAPGGIKTELSIPLPDVGTGAFTLTGITLYSHFDLTVVNGFEVATGLWLSKPDRPFGLAILFLGGGGWFGVDARYRPPRVFETRVSVGISAGAFIAINFGVVHGSAGILFTVGLDFYKNWKSGGGSSYAISIGLLVWGGFSVLGIASAYLRLGMRIEYRDGSMTGYGYVSITIKISWCFKLKVRSQVTMKFAGGGNRAVGAAAVMPPPIDEVIDAYVKNLDW